MGLLSRWTNFATETKLPEHLRRRLQMPTELFIYFL